MSGVDTALFVNDVCGQPLPWDHCCPWGFFDGKLFQSKLAKATRDRAALLDMCEGQVPILFLYYFIYTFYPLIIWQIFFGIDWRSSKLKMWSSLLHPTLWQEELVSRVEKMRQAILEGINLSRPPPPPPPLPPPAFLPPAMVPPFYPMHPLYPPRPLGSMPPPHHQHRPRAFPGLISLLFWFHFFCPMSMIIKPVY